MNDLANRIGFVILMLIIYRIGTYIPVPGIDSTALATVAIANTDGILGMFNMFTGGALGRMSIFAINIMPYITASIVMQLLSMVFKTLGDMRKDGGAGKIKMTKYTRYLAIALAIFQAYGVAVGVEAIGGETPIVVNPGAIFKISSVLTMLGGTMFLIWITDQITIKGIGNGSSLIIFTGIIAGVPGAIGSLIEMGRAGNISSGLIFPLLIACIFLVIIIVFFEKAQRQIQVHYPKRHTGHAGGGGYGRDSMHLPLKLNTSGVLGPIFASSLLLFIGTALSFWVPSDPESWYYILVSQLSHGRTLYILLYVALICFFSFFYTSVMFNSTETADNLKKAGAVVVGRRPGAQTAEYLEYVLVRITTIGALYVSFICAVPEILIAKYAIPFYLGGTSLLIMVNVVLDMFQQIQTYLLSNQYGKLMKRGSMLMGR